MTGWANKHQEGARTAAFLGMLRALEDEIRAGQTDPTRAFVVREGRRVPGAQYGYLYRFTAEAPRHLPPESPVRFTTNGRVDIPGILVAAEQVGVLLQLREDLGDQVPQGTVTSEPWFVYAALRDRLNDVLEEHSSFPEVTRAILGQQEPLVRPNDNISGGILSALKELGDPAQLLNECQERALERSLTRTAHFIWGPPGTGKTVCLAQIARGAVTLGERVMVLAHSNAAVDVAMLRVADAFSETAELTEGRVLRVGTPQLSAVRNHPWIIPEAVVARDQPDLIAQKNLLERQLRELIVRLWGTDTPTQDTRSGGIVGAEIERVRTELRAVEEVFRMARNELVALATVVGATLSRLAIDDSLWGWPADAVLIDETSMAPYPSVVAASIIARERVIILGDFRQLPPINIADTEDARRWLGRDAFEISGVKRRADLGEQDSRVTLLDTQYRMSDRIARIVSKLAYDNRLRTSERMKSRTAPVLAAEPWPHRDLVLADTGGLAPGCYGDVAPGSYSRHNPVQAVLSWLLASTAWTAGSDETIALITPYRAQTRLLSGLIYGSRVRQRMHAATVHRFQGGEADIVIVDLVDTYPQTSPTNLTGRDPEVALRHSCDPLGG